MTLQVLMTPDCQVICVGDDGQFHSCSLEKVREAKGLVGVVRQGAHCHLRSVQGDVRWYDASVKKMVSLLPARGVTVEVRGVGLNVLRADQHYLSIDWAGHINFDATDTSSAVELRFLALDDLYRLCDVVRHQWVIGPSGEPAHVRLERSSLETLFMGDIKFSFDQFMEGVRQFEKRGELLLNEGWKIWRFVPFRPLMVLEAFGASSIQELKVMLDSLVEMGCYHGRVMITTNQAEHDVRSIIPEGLSRHEVQILPVADQDRFAALRTRSRLMADPLLLEGYAPILFCGSGIVFDGDVKRLLGRAALTRQVSASGYFFHPEFSDNQEEKDAALSLKEGQTVDLMVVPNMKQHRPYLEAAFDLLTLCIQEYGDAALPKEIQCVLNYGLRQIGDFSPYLVEHAMHSDCQVTVNPFHAIGLTGFGKGDDRHERMARYLNNVRQLWGAEL